MGDKIFLKNMMFYGFHGVYEHERELGQRFYVDVELTMDVTKAAQTDDVRDTIDYLNVYEHTKAVVENKKFNLLEALAGHIADGLLSPGISQVVVRVRKHVPIPGQIDFVQVEVARRQ
ncbi:MAG TPA: dihydroneopterin aldolase [Selenomonadales bacterium]|nr:dihydroneopterin aldolase [Selenomonadales bacterium]